MLTPDPCATPPPLDTIPEINPAELEALLQLSNHADSDSAPSSPSHALPPPLASLHGPSR